MPWVPKGSTAEAAAAEEVEKPQKKTREPRSKGEGKASESKGGGDKGGKKGKSKGEGDKGGDKGGGKKGKGKGKEEDRSWDKGGSRGWDSGGKGGKSSKGDYKGDSKGKSFKGDDEAGKRGPKGGKKGDKGGKSNDRPRDDDEERPERTDRPLRSEDMRRQATASTGKHCTVRKHSSMGCAVVSMHSPAARQAILAAGLKIEISGHTLTIRAHFEKETKEEIMTDIFAGWGRQAEKTDPLSEEDLSAYFDEKHIEFTTTGRCSLQGPGARQMTEDDKRAAAQKTAEAQAQWAASGGQQSPSGRAAVPVGPAPMGMPGAVPGAPGVPGQPALAQQQAQAQQAQYMAAMQAQAQYVMRYQQQQAAYYAAVQAQQAQQQQAYYMQQLKAQQEQQAQAAGKTRKAGYKASYRVPTDDEVKATLMRLSGGGASAEPAAADAAEAAPAAAAEAAAPAAEAPVAEA